MYQKLLQKYRLISDQVDQSELLVVLRELNNVLVLDRGHVVEFGCYIGTTSLFIRRLLDLKSSAAEFHVYDSFEGLPAKSDLDQNAAGIDFKSGGLLASKKQLLLNFKKAGLRAPYVHKGWFKDLSPEDVPSEIIFAYLDGDFYHSIIDSLGLIWPKMMSGATIIIDDYANPALPGVEAAVRDWQKTHEFQITIEKSLAILKL